MKSFRLISILRNSVQPQISHLNTDKNGSKNGFNRCLKGHLFCLLISLLMVAPTVRADFAFVHPGLLQSRADLTRMKMAVATKQEPIYSGYEIFRTNAQSQLDYKMRGPLAMVGRNPTVGQDTYNSDANAAYQCALMWCITGDMAYANKSKRIINAWSARLKSITGRDAVLMAGLGPFKMVNAAEILRYTDAGWSPEEVRQTETHFRGVIYPVIQDFAPFANGNWDLAAVKTMMAIGVFCNDRAMFERALAYYVNGAGDGRLTHYISNVTGQCQESGRDQQHTQLGLAHLGDCCEIAWHQGLDLYGYDDNLLLKGFEYTAEYNLGGNVPFLETIDRTGKYHHTEIAEAGRGVFRGVFEEIYNAYAVRKAVATPYTQQVVARIRPEGVGVSSAPQGADHVGFGTLLFAQPVSGTAPAQKRVPPAAPGAAFAEAAQQDIQLRWVASIGADSYTIKRTAKNGACQIIARNIASSSYADTKVQAGEVYQYEVSAVNAYGESPDSYPTSICAGLPAPWTHEDIGDIKVSGGASFDGQTFTIDGAGADIGGTNDQCQFAGAPMSGDDIIVARFVPQPSSQFSKYGLMMRESPASDAANVALLISPAAGWNFEAPEWSAKLTVRESAGAAATDRATSDEFSQTMVTYGRLTGYCWLKLERAGNSFIASFSPDGQNWREVGVVRVPLAQKLLVGLCASSRIDTVETSVKCDEVMVAKTADQNIRTVNQIKSPDGNVAVSFCLLPGGVPAYSIEYLATPIVLESRLGLMPDFTNGFVVKKISHLSHHGEWFPLYGERKVIPDNYRELIVDLGQASGRALRLTFRAYDEGAAFRYSFPVPGTKIFHFSGEWTEFRFPKNTFCYEEHGTEGEYQRAEVSTIQPWCERPLTLEFSSGLFACLCEAENTNYPRLLLSTIADTADALVSTLGGTTSNTAKDPSAGDPSATLQAGDSTPWRMFVVGKKPGDLLERNYLMQDLNSPQALRDVSWIKPGKLMRDTTLTTTNSKAIIDFATTAGLQYVMLDAGWYGAQDFETGDATQARPGGNRWFPNSGLAPDIQEIIRYGREKNVGMILYVDRRQMKKQRDILFPLYEKWGVKGVKIGFVDVGPQTETAWITETIKRAAEHHLLLDIHDGYRPTGLERTYPNLLTVEGVRGNEHFPTPEHNCTLPFTRYVAGSADYTVCYYDERLQTTHAHQLAMAVVSYSPLQSVLWYDKPSAYQGEPEIEFFRHVPTVWDETKVINGEIGRFATIARRSGQNWFVGTINNSEPRQLNCPLSFLTPGAHYLAHIYSDDDSVPTRTHVAVKSRPVDSLTTLEVPLLAAGGQAVWITPMQGEEK